MSNKVHTLKSLRKNGTNSETVICAYPQKYIENKINAVLHK